MREREEERWRRQQEDSMDRHTIRQTDNHIAIVNRKEERENQR